NSGGPLVAIGPRIRYFGSLMFSGMATARDTCALGEPASAVGPFEVAERLKAEAERQLFIVPGEATPIAREIERLGVAVNAPQIQALGAMAAADALRE